MKKVFGGYKERISERETCIEKRFSSNPKNSNPCLTTSIIPEASPTARILVVLLVGWRSCAQDNG